MIAGDEGLLVIVSNTGPLVSAFQSDSLDLITALFGTVHISGTCRDELIGHGWGEALVQFGSRIVTHMVTDSEKEQAAELARRIATHPKSRDPEPDHHMGEAEVMILAQRPDFDGAVLLLDELAARAVATEIGLDISGFAGVLLLAVDEGLLTADEVQEKLNRCQQQGTHYSAAFIEQVYKAAKEG